MCNGAMAHFTVINRVVAHCFKKVGHPEPILKACLSSILVPMSVNACMLTDPKCNFES